MPLEAMNGNLESAVVFNFENGWSVNVGMHSTNCSSVAVIPTRIQFNPKGDWRSILTWAEDHKDDDMYAIHHCSDNRLANVLATVAGWAEEAGLAEWRKSADVALADIVKKAGR